MCLKDGRINAATIADHIEPHKGDEQKFFFGELQSLCKLHHEPRLLDPDRRRWLASRPKASRIFGGYEIFLRLPPNATAETAESLEN
jgi:hypothetical protein